MNEFTFSDSKAAINLAKHLYGKNKITTRKVSNFLSRCQRGFKWLDKIGDKDIYVKMLILWDHDNTRGIDEDLKIQDEFIKKSMKSIITTSFRRRFRKINEIKSKHDNITI